MPTFTQLEMREMWTYTDGALTAKAYRRPEKPGQTARPHALMVPRRHRDGWSCAPAAELSARHTAMTLVAAWYRSLALAAGLRAAAQQRATDGQRADFETFAAERGLNARSLAVSPLAWTRDT